MTDATRVLTIRHQLHPARRRKRFIRGRRMMGGCLLVAAPLGWLFPQFVSGLEPSFHQSVVSEWNNNHPIEWWLDDTTTARSNGRRLKRATVEEVICQEKEACSLCTATDKELIAECAKTGKIKTLSCRKRDDANSGTDSEDETDEQSSSKTVYQSCKRTAEDEQFLMLQLQVLWLLTGVFALTSARKQKNLNASLFDQRKEQRKKRSTSDHGVELAPQSSSSSRIMIIGDEETMPLTSNDNLDIV